jgi:hypothetical protein
MSSALEDKDRSAFGCTPTYFFSPHLTGTRAAVQSPCDIAPHATSATCRQGMRDSVRRVSFLSVIAAKNLIQPLIGPTDIAAGQESHDLASDYELPCRSRQNYCSSSS